LLYVVLLSKEACSVVGFPDENPDVRIYMLHQKQVIKLMKINFRKGFEYEGK